MVKKSITKYSNISILFNINKKHFFQPAPPYLDTRISNGRTPDVVERIARVPFRFRQDKRIAREQALVAAVVKAKLDALDLSGAIRRDPVVDELRNAARQARR
jgi:hypothetical protein